jgi:hypothetical protein
MNVLISLCTLLHGGMVSGSLPQLFHRLYQPCSRPTALRVWGLLSHLSLLPSEPAQSALHFQSHLTTLESRCNASGVS